MEYLDFAKITQNATIPMRQSTQAAAVDLHSAYQYIVPPKSCEIIKTDLQVKLPPETYGRIAPRARLSTTGILINAGVIDRDYTGNIKIVIINLTATNFIINKGDRIAQFIVEKIKIMPTREIFPIIPLPNTRGKQGFGSTGI